MTAQVVLSISLILIPLLNGFQDTFFSAFFSYLSSTNEQIIIGRLDEDIILPCSFKSGSEIIIHWQTQSTINVHSYYRGSDHLERQDPRYTNRTSLFQSEIHNGNASLSLRRLSLVDEGIYICYVGTTFGKIMNNVVLKVGGNCHLCSLLSKCDLENAFEIFIFNDVSFSILLSDDLHRMQSEHVSLSCQLVNNSFPPNQDFRVTWSRVESGTSFVLADYLSSSQNIIINEPRISWNKELKNQSDFSVNLTDLSLSDTGEYLCNISSSKYTLLTVYTLHVGKLQSESILLPCFMPCCLLCPFMNVGSIWDFLPEELTFIAIEMKTYFGWYP
uniref:Ig-like domain-containing protein n=1 Tax=Propithecus coquereli TaxID=379532 RepID=A0A2K6ETC9_PROCO